MTEYLHTVQLDIVRIIQTKKSFSHLASLVNEYLPWCSVPEIWTQG